MKLLIPLLALTPMALVSGWDLVLDKQVWNGGGDQGCTGGFKYGNGELLEWDRAWYSTCCIHLYKDGKCKTQVGYSCASWKKTLDQTVESFKVDSCGILDKDRKE